MTQKIPARRPKGRHDATRVPMGSGLNAMFPYIMKRRCDSLAFFPLTVDMENLMAYIEANKGTDKEITIFQAVLLALTQILRERPSLNRYIMGRRMYQRHNVDLSFVARREYTDQGTETNVNVTIKPGEHREEILRKLRGEVRRAKSGEDKEDDQMIAAFLKMPRGVLRFALWLIEKYDFYVDTPKFLRGVDPLRCSAFVANLGSVGLGAPYHHLFEWGTCSMFICVGKMEPRVVVSDAGQPVVRRVMDLRIVLDERIADGFYDAKALELFNKFMGEPALLEQV